MSVIIVSSWVFLHEPALELREIFRHLVKAISCHRRFYIILSFQFDFSLCPIITILLLIISIRVAVLGKCRSLFLSCSARLKILDWLFLAGGRRGRGSVILIDSSVVALVDQHHVLFAHDLVPLHEYSLLSLPVLLKLSTTL